MNLIWTPAGSQPVTLGDDTNGKTIFVESVGGQADVQTAKFFRGAFAAKYPRGNVEGQFVFVVQQSFPNEDLTSAYIKSEYGRLNQQGSMAWGRAGTIFTFANSILRAVTVAELAGVRIRMRYTLEFTTMV